MSSRGAVVRKARALRQQSLRLCEASKELCRQAAALQARATQQRDALAARRLRSDPHEASQLWAEYCAWRRDAGLLPPPHVEARFLLWTWSAALRCGVVFAPWGLREE